MAKIVVFDSGLGSLSIIKSIQKTMKSEIIYFADRKNFPYGLKTKKQLRKIILETIDFLKEKFSPDLIIIGSNTPTLLFPSLITRNVMGVLPPLEKANKISTTKSIGILATKLATQSPELINFIHKIKLESIVTTINASPLVELVESGKFLTNKTYSRKIIRNSLNKIIEKNEIDVLTLSSTHLPFLLTILKTEFPKIKFVDPATDLANQVSKKLKQKKSQRNKISIYTSNDRTTFQKNLKKIGVHNRVNFLSLP